MDLHQEQHQKMMRILSKIARGKNKSAQRVERLIFVQHNNALIRLFWQIFDEQFPNHSFQYIGRCSECGNFELRQQAPYDALFDALQTGVGFPFDTTQPEIYFEPPPHTYDETS